MPIEDTKTLMTIVNIVVNLPIYSSIIMLSCLKYSSLTYVKSTRHIKLEITNHEEYVDVEVVAGGINLHV
jgi:hypothetical protein